MPNNMQRIRSRSKPRSGGRINHHSHWMVAVAIVLVIIGSCVPFPPRWRPFLLEARAYTSSPPPTTLDGSSSRRHRSTSIVGARMHRRLQFHHSAVAIASSQRPSQPTTHFGVRANIIRLFGADDDAAVGGGGRGTTTNSSTIHDEDRPSSSNIREYSSLGASSNIEDEDVVNGSLLPHSAMMSTSVRPSTINSSRRRTGLPSTAPPSAFPPLSGVLPPLPSRRGLSTSGYAATPTTTTMTTTTTTMKEETTTPWKDRLVIVTNFASLLCVLDCTLLPLVSMAIPALSFGAGILSSSSSATGSSAGLAASALSHLNAHLPGISHGIAMWFVLPVGMLTAATNYVFGHGRMRFALASMLGLSLIYLANSSVGTGIPVVDALIGSWGISDVGVGGIEIRQHVHDACGAVVGAATGMMAHTCHPEGLAHKLTNTLGCGLLLGSNHYGKKHNMEGSCAASVLVEAWGAGDENAGGGGGRVVVCLDPSCLDPSCGEAPAYGASASVASKKAGGGENFFRWERTQQRGGGNAEVSD